MSGTVRGTACNMSECVWATRGSSSDFSERQRDDDNKGPRKQSALVVATEQMGVKKADGRW